MRRQSQDTIYVIYSTKILLFIIKMANLWKRKLIVIGKERKTKSGLRCSFEKVWFIFSISLMMPYINLMMEEERKSSNIK